MTQTEGRGGGIIKIQKDKSIEIAKSLLGLAAGSNDSAVTTSINTPKRTSNKTTSLVTPKTAEMAKKTVENDAARTDVTPKNTEKPVPPDTTEKTECANKNDAAVITPKTTEGAASATETDDTSSDCQFDKLVKSIASPSPKTAGATNELDSSPLFNKELFKSLGTDSDENALDAALQDIPYEEQVETTSSVTGLEEQEVQSTSNVALNSGGGELSALGKRMRNTQNTEEVCLNNQKVYIVVCCLLLTKVQM